MQFISREGPVLPHQLAKFVGSNLIIAGAQLADLSARRKVIVSSIKVGGGSPLYYVPGQEEKLQNFIENLNEKDRATTLLLKEKKILRDSELDPLSRVSLRNIKDFAKPLEVNINNQKEIFWKWYLLKNEEVSSLLESLLKPVVEPPKAEVKEEIKPEIKKEPEVKVEKPAVKREVRPRLEEVKRIEKPKLEIKIKKPEIKKEIIKEVKKPEIKTEIKKVELPKELVKEEKQILLEKLEEEKKEAKKEIQSDFFERIKNYLLLKNIKITHYQILRKTEIDLMIKVPTAIGEIDYFCKAKAKKKCDDKDVSAAFLEGQIRKLPVAFLYSGEMTQKAEERMQQEIFKNLILLHLD